MEPVMSTPLRELLNNVLFDPETRAALGGDPATFLADHGWSTLEGTDLEEAVAALADGLPIETAEAITMACEGVDFAADPDVGQLLAAVATDIATELPTALEPADGVTDAVLADGDLDFGVGASQADTDGALDEEPDFDSDALDADDLDDLDHLHDLDDLDDLGLVEEPAFADELDSLDVETQHSYLPDDSLDAEPAVAPENDIDDLDLDVL